MRVFCHNWFSQHQGDPALVFLKVTFFFKILGSPQHAPFPISLHHEPLSDSAAQVSLSGSLKTDCLSTEDCRVSACRLVTRESEMAVLAWLLTFRSVTSVTSWSLLLLLHPLQSKRALQKQKMFTKVFPLLSRFVPGGAVWHSLGQKQGRTGAGGAIFMKILTGTRLAARAPAAETTRNYKPPQRIVYKSITLLKGCYVLFLGLFRTAAMVGTLLC